MSLEARNKPLSDWLSDVQQHRVVLPRFQRYEAWGNREISDLLQTVLRGLPAGSLLTQHVTADPLFRWRALESAPTSGGHVSSLLLDGQQRLTALWRATKDNYSRHTFFVKLPEGELDFSNTEVQPVSFTLKEGVRYPLWMGDARECWKRHLVPVFLLDPERGGEINVWALSATENDLNATLELAQHINNLRAQLANFNLPFLELPASTPREVVLDVFVKLNTRSVKLSAFDIVVAEVEELDQSLHDLVAGIKGRVPRLLAYQSEPEDLLLSVACLLQDRVPSQAGYLGLDLEKMVADWDILERGVKAGVQFLEEQRIFDALRLPAEPPLAPLFALFAQAPTQPDKLGAFKHLCQKYLWRSFFSNRYESAAASAALQDYRALLSVMNETGTESQVPCFDSNIAPLPSAESLKSAGWPRTRQRLARAVLALSLRGQALDIADSTPVSRDHILQREYHHLFPQAFLKRQGKSDGEIMRALNCALISWGTNRTISDNSPADYLSDRIKSAPGDAALADSLIKSRLESHGIDFDTLVAQGYEAFLEERAQWAKGGMETLCAGQSWPH